MATNQCAKGPNTYQRYPKRRALPWRTGAQGRTRLLAIFFTVLSASAVAMTIEDRDRFDNIVATLAKSDHVQEQSVFCKGKCLLAKFSYRLTSSDIDNLGSKNLLEVLGHFPGVFLNVTHDGSLHAGIFGTVSNPRLALIIDQKRYNNPYSSSLFFNMPAQFIDYVEVYFGPSATWFGEDSLLGVINVVTKTMPGAHTFGYVGNLPEMGFGFSLITHGSRIKSGVNFSFMGQSPEEGSPLSPYLTYDKSFIERHANESIFAKGFVDASLSRQAEVNLNFDSHLSLDHVGPVYSLFGAKHMRNQEKTFLWHNDMHVIKRRMGKNFLDVAIKTSWFFGDLNKALLGRDLIPIDEPVHRHFSVIRAELAPHFYFRPSLGHLAFIGLGSVVEKCTGSYLGSRGHIYVAMQDEWLISGPLAVTLGTRAALPFTNRFSPDIFPNLGVVFSPTSQLRFKVVFQTSWRNPNFQELTQEKALQKENSNSIGTSMWFSQNIGTTRFSNDISLYLGEVLGAIEIDEIPQPFTNNHRLDLLGLRTNTEVIFSGGHSLTLGLYFSLAGKKTTSLKYGILRRLVTDFSPGFGPEVLNMPRLMGQMAINFNLLAGGNLNIAGSFFSLSQGAYGLAQPKSSLTFTYLSKPIFRHLSVNASVEALFKAPEIAHEKSPDGLHKNGGILATFGFVVSG